MSDSSTEAAPTLNNSRLHARLAQLAAIGGLENGGVTRLAYSAEDVAGRDLVADWMSEAGLQVQVDEACNLIGTSPGSRQNAGALVTGSHLDTVKNGGRYDGAYGVVAGVEVADALLRLGATNHPLKVVAFANEEGANGSDSFDGSLAIAGRPNPLDGLDRTNATLAERINNAGGRSSAIANAAWTDPVAAFLEVHIEQGPVLHNSDASIGIVTGVTGRRNLDITIDGKPNHAGTTPMDLRCDALTVAAQAILLVEQLPRNSGVRVATTGALEISPNVRNVVPGRAGLAVEVRDLDDAVMDHAISVLEAQLDELASRSGSTIAIAGSQAAEPVPTEESLMAALEEAANHCGLESLRMVSGAGHDAQVMAALGPIGMLFVPSRNGISHSPDEHTDASALEDGARVLLKTFATLDKELP